MRTFVAIELPETIRTSLEQLQNNLRRSNARASWVQHPNMHLTLRFLGDLPEKAVPELAALLQAACARHQTLTLALQGTGVFPNTRRPAVVWAGLETLSGDFPALQADIEAAVRAIGVPPDDKPFHPHITLGRLRDPRQIGDLLDRLQATVQFGSDDFTVNTVALFSSDLRPAGPVYQRLREFPLSC